MFECGDIFFLLASYVLAPVIAVYLGNCLWDSTKRFLDRRTPDSSPDVSAHARPDAKLDTRPNINPDSSADQTPKRQEEFDDLLAEAQKLRRLINQAYVNLYFNSGAVPPQYERKAFRNMRRDIQDIVGRLEAAEPHLRGDMDIQEVLGYPLPSDTESD